MPGQVQAFKGLACRQGTVTDDGQHLFLAAGQIADDILDVVSDTATLGKPAGSDAEQGKNTYPALVGLDESRRLAREQADAACAALAGFSGPEAEFLRALAEYTITRAA